MPSLEELRGEMTSIWCVNKHVTKTTSDRHRHSEGTKADQAVARAHGEWSLHEAWLTKQRLRQGEELRCSAERAPMLEEKPAKGGDGLILALRVKELGCLGQSARKGRPGRRKREGHVEPWLHG